MRFSNSILILVTVWTMQSQSSTQPFYAKIFTRRRSHKRMVILVASLARSFTTQIWIGSAQTRVRWMSCWTRGTLAKAIISSWLSISVKSPKTKTSSKKLQATLTKLRNPAILLMTHKIKRVISMSTLSSWDRHSIRTYTLRTRLCSIRWNSVSRGTWKPIGLKGHSMRYNRPRLISTISSCSEGLLRKSSPTLTTSKVILLMLILQIKASFSSLWYRAVR